MLVTSAVCPWPGSSRPAGRAGRSGEAMRKERRRLPPASYGAEYTLNLRWGYRPGLGEGSADEPYLSGGSFGVGYGRAGTPGPHSPPSPWGSDYRGRSRARSSRRPGTAARDYGRAFPYFGSAAAVDAAQGYPPGDTLVPESHERPGRLTRNWYDADYDEPSTSGRRRSPRRRRRP